MERRSGFTLLELLIATIFLVVAVVSMFSFFTSSNRGSLDAYREAIAYSLAQEAQEWVAGLGYEKLVEMQLNPANPLVTRLGLDNFVSIESVRLDDGSLVNYPTDYQQFERKIQLVHFPSDKIILVRVTVQPKTKAFIRRGSVVLEKIVGAEYD
ncbi:MAG: hypothetical protein HQM09_02960 [Candidatus Riflebacteria bacterium]|nr:hypothetical protein [Candidatus Riflebacteria bacterium]